MRADLQCAWQLHSLRTMPPNLTCRTCESARRRHVADSGNSRHGSGTGIPQGLGNLINEDGRVGSQVCNQMCRVSVWASWADALRTPQVNEMGVWESFRRHPTIMARTSSWQTTAAEHNRGQTSGNTVATLGFHSDVFLGKTQMLSLRPTSCHAHLRFHSGHDAGAPLAGAPTAPTRDSPPPVPDHASGKAPSYLSRSMRQNTTGTRVLQIHWGDTERVNEQAGCGNVQPTLNV